MYDAEYNSWYIRETGIMFGIRKLPGFIFIGRTKEGFSQNKVINGALGWTVERQTALDVIPILADGIKWLGFLPRQRLFWNVGIYMDWLSHIQKFSTYHWQFSSRVGWLPIYSEEDNTLFHIGVNYRYGEVKGGEIALKSRPEVILSPFFINTGTFQTNNSNHLGGEIYFERGPLMLGSEYYVHMINSPETGDPVFHGGEVVLTYIITGESRIYATQNSIWTYVPVGRSVFKGGPGAWEVVVRFSAFDLDDGTLTGGKLWRITPMVNWYPTRIIRLALAYGYSVLDRYSIKGATHIFQGRLQFIL